MKISDLAHVNQLQQRRSLLTERLNNIGMWEMDEVQGMRLSVGKGNGGVFAVLDDKVLDGQEEIASAVAGAVSKLLKSELEIVENELRDKYGVEVDD